MGVVVVMCALRRFWVAAGVLVFTATFAVPADAIKPSRKEVAPQQAVAVIAKGPVWFDDGTIRLQPFVGDNATLGWVSPSEVRERFPQMAASGTAVAALLRRRGAEGVPEFIGGVPPHPLASIPQPQPLSGGGCKRWEPATQAAVGDFVVAGDTLVSAAECDGEPVIGGETPVIENEPFELQPLFARNLRGGRWRVLRWLPGESPPLLTAEGNRVAVGIQFTPAQMEVSIVDVQSGQTHAHFGAPDGYLSFAAPERLVLSTPAFAHPGEYSFPLRPRVLESSTSGSQVGYSLALYSTRGKRIAGIGSAQEPPLVSKMRLVTVQTAGQPRSSRVTETPSAISVRSLLNGTTTQVIGFNPPGRQLIALAFRWPALAVVQTTSAQRSQSEVTCENESEFKEASRPFLSVFDLAQAEPFVAPPPSPHLVRAQSCPPQRFVAVVAWERRR